VISGGSLSWLRKKVKQKVNLVNNQNPKLKFPHPEQKILICGNIKAGKLIVTPNLAENLKLKTIIIGGFYAKKQKRDIKTQNSNKAKTKTPSESDQSKIEI
jgi:hypothetical protein